MSIRIVFDPAKRDRTLRERGLDFARCGEVFTAPHDTRQDTRQAYGETRRVTTGFLDGRMVVVVRTDRGGARRIISLRKANDREQARYARIL